MATALPSWPPSLPEPPRKPALRYHVLVGDVVIASADSLHLAHLYLCAEVLGALDLAASAREAVAA